MSLLAITLFIFTMALSLWATIRVRRVYGHYSQVPASSGLTGAEVAAFINFARLFPDALAPAPWRAP